MRTKKLTYAELLQSRDVARMDADLHARALQVVLTETADAKATARETDDRACKYTFAVYRSASPSGGIIVTTFERPGQCASVRADHYDHWCTGRESMPVWMARAAETLAADVRRMAS